jgi:hypothetical protein
MVGNQATFCSLICSIRLALINWSTPNQHAFVGHGETFDEVGIGRGAHVRCRSQFALGHVADFAYGIDDHAHRQLSALTVDPDDDHDRGRTELRCLDTESHAQINDRHDGAAQIDDPEHVVGGMRNAGGLVPTFDLLYAQDVYAVHLPCH